MSISFKEPPPKELWSATGTPFGWGMGPAPFAIDNDLDTMWHDLRQGLGELG